MSAFRNLFYAGLLCLSLVLSGCQVREESFPESVVGSIETRVQAGINPSIAVGIIDQHGTRYYNFGKRSANGPAVDEHTIYEIGSISKVFTAILLAQQVLDGRVSVDEPINKYLPGEAQVPIKGSAEITLGHLSDHTSGFPRMPDNFTPANPNNPYADYSVQQMYSFISTSGPVRTAGAQYEYSNLGQGLLGHILAMNSDLTYDSLMIRNIASLLGMEETKIVLNQRMRDNLAIGHSGGAEVENWDIPTLAGAGGIRSSTSDMLKFLAANLGLTETPLLAAMDMTHAVRHSKAGDMRVGLGWFIKKGEHGDVIWHGGGTGGYRAFAGFVKETGKGVVVLTNSSENIQDIGFHLLDPETKLIEIRSKSDAIKVPEEILDRYVGKYELNPDFHITITREGEQLYVQATGQPKLELYAETEHKFYLIVVNAEITFNVERENVESLTLFKEGQKMKGRKVE